MDSILQPTIPSPPSGSKGIRGRPRGRPQLVGEEEQRQDHEDNALDRTELGIEQVSLQVEPSHLRRKRVPPY